VLRRLLLGIVGFGVFVSIVGFLEFLGILGPTAYATGLLIGGRNYARVIGTLGNPNNLGLFLGLAILAAGWGAVLQPRVRTIAIVVMLAALALTSSKGACVALGLTAVLAFRPWRGRGRVVAAVAALAVCLAFAAVAVATRAGSESPVVGDRTTSVPSAIHATTESPKSLFFGHGFGTQSTVVNGEVRAAVSDNMALALTYEGGLPALILFGALVAISVRVAYRAWRRAQPAGDGLLVPWALYVPLVLLYSPFAVTFRLYPGAMLYWIGVGLMIAGAWSPAREREWNSL